uniref:Insulin-like domain-containing protein n=1 Tax=Timema shepardi TaxID=629360 RepID=A0A7R9G251_TIMSH|nr:unnamed protein product [Timema shepardi]
MHQKVASACEAYWDHLGIMWRHSLRLVTIAVIACLFTLTHAQSDSLKILEKREFQLCGKHLADIVKLVCKGVYNTHFKKSTQEATLDDWPESPIIEEPPRFPFRTRSNSASFQPVESSRRSRRGIVDECCAKSCTLEVIQSYCGAR